MLELRTKPIDTIGLDIVNTEIRFMELTVKPVGLVPFRFGSVGIAHDVVEDGKILDRTSLVESFKRLRGKTTAHTVVFPGFENESLNESWSEVLNVAGFARAVHIPRSTVLHQHAFADVMDRQVLGHVNTDGELEVRVYLYGVLETQERLALPLNESHISTLREIIEMGDGTIMRLSGDVNRLHDQDHVHMREAGIHIDVVDVWNGCFSTDDHVPQLVQTDAYGYSLAIACARLGARYSYIPEKQEKPSLTVIKKPVVQDTTLLEETPSVVDTQLEVQTEPSGLSETPAVATSQIKEKHTEPSSGLQQAMERSGELPVMTPETGQKDTPEISVSVDTAVSPAETSQENKSKPVEGGTLASKTEESVWLRDVDEILKGMFSK